MKTIVSRILIVLLVLSSILTMAASPNNHRVQFTPFTGTESGVGLIDMGTIKVVDGKTITRGLVVHDVDVMSDDRVSGDAITTVNSVYNGPAFTGTGPLWGSAYLSNGVGGWNITLEGHQYEGCITVVHGRGSGEGVYEGLKAVWEWQSTNCMFTSSVSGYIIEHQ